MAGRQYYVITALPSLGEIGSTPPMKLRELLRHVGESAKGREVVSAVLLGDDLLQRDALLAGEIQEPDPAVLSPRQLRDEEPLPAYLAGGEDAGPARRVAADDLWAAYYRYAASVARSRKCEFLARWVAHEVALKNALAEARARSLDLEAAEYLVAVELADEGADFARLLNEWSAAKDPLAGLKVLDGARWTWLGENDAWFSFADDELAAYAAKLMLLQRWHRLTADRVPGAPSSERTEP